MIDAVKNETPEEKTFRILKKCDYKTIAKVVTNFESKNVSFRYICKENAILELDVKLATLKNAIKTEEDRKKYEKEFSVMWGNRSALQKNLVDPSTYLDALEAHIWKYGWTLAEYLAYSSK